MTQRLIALLIAITAMLLLACTPDTPVTPPLAPTLAPVETPTPKPTPPPIPDHPTKDLNITVAPGLTLADTEFLVQGIVQLVDIFPCKTEPPDCPEPLPGETNLARALEGAIRALNPKDDDVHACLIIPPAGPCPPVDVWVGVAGPEDTVDATVTLKPQALAHQLLDNTGSSTAATLKAELSQSISISSESHWDESETTEHSYTVNVEVGFGDEKSGGADAYSYSVTRGHGGSDSRTVDVGISEGVDVEVAPNSAKLAILLVQLGTLQAEVELEPVWDGTGMGWCLGDVPCLSPRALWEEGFVYSLDQLRPHLPPAHDIIGGADKLTVTVNFAADDIIRIVDLDDTSPQGISDKIDEVVCEWSGSC